MKKLLLIALIFIFSQINAQSPESSNYGFNEKWQINANFGSNLFYGDLRVYDFFPVRKYNNERKWGYGLQLKKQLSPVFSVYGQLMSGNLSGTRRAPANKYFEANILEYFIATNINVIPLLKKSDSCKISLYGILGIGFIDFRTIKRNRITDEFIYSYGYDSEGKKTGEAVTETVIPTGVGIDYKINKNLSANLEIILVNINTDKLDATVRQKKDKNGYTSLGLTYTFDFKKAVKEVPKEPMVTPLVQQEEMNQDTVIEKQDTVVENKEPAVDTSLANKEIPIPQIPVKKEISVEEFHKLPAEGIMYRVQILALSKNKISENRVASMFGLGQKVYMENVSGLNRYTTGEYKTFAEADNNKNKLVSTKGIKDAFVVAYYNNNRISIRESLQIIEKNMK